MYGTSEVANLMAAIEAQDEAARNALYGPAQGIAQHTFITARYEEIWRIKGELSKLVGEEPAVKMVIERLNGEEESHE